MVHTAGGYAPAMTFYEIGVSGDDRRSENAVLLRIETIMIPSTKPSEQGC
ncbi:MAG: hypothetical protein R2912_08825 [Eubacteriales bacterium]